MYVIFFLLWIIFNGRITTEIVIFGLAVAAALYGFICKFMDFSPKRELLYLKKSGYLLQYLYHLIKEIIIANFATMRLICSAGRVVEPALIEFETHFRNDISRFLLANSITLTPGTITVAVDGDKFIVHCLDKTLADGIESSVFVRLLEKIEA
ncbi:MAG: Na+/H+ antiporter subunit E [Lachnospiraceae bacterium]|nr:Na+/H+ antiporter subunit E [Lachnospiraceae bacterium]MDE7273653.1 Na+/H+ antiporter subunit E [Lachnospiraceae bacterium]